MPKIKDKKAAIEALQNCDEFYLFYETKGKKSGFWNIGDYAKMVGILTIAREWFKREVMEIL